MLTSRGLVRTARAIAVCLLALLVGPGLGQIATQASSASVPCSARACCRRADTRGGCPHGNEMAHDHHCQRAVCVLTCPDHHTAAVVPVVLIGFSPTSIVNEPCLAASDLRVDANGAVRCLAGLPLTPPPRTLSL